MTIPKNVELYRCKLHCKLARDVIDKGGEGTLPPGTPCVEYALFLLAHAIEEIAEHLDCEEPTKSGGRE